MQRRILFLLGKRPRPGTVVAEVVDLLAGRGVAGAVLLPHEQRVGVGEVQHADLVVHRGLSGPDEDLLSTLAAVGPPMCNPGAGLRHLQDRASLHHALDAAGVPSPRGVVRRAWSDVLAEEGHRRVVVKAVTGPGRGHGVVPSPLPQDPPVDGPYLVEELVEHDGVDRKLYVAGERVFGLLKRSTLTRPHSTAGLPFTPSAELVGTARRTLQHLQLHLAGVDVVLGPEGPVVVDVNAFPGFRGVEGAAKAVADHLFSHLR